ncbi:hypothetical protein [Hymenobacter sp. GOD-10R]|uniref:hypothetical protein n=1 Tax=Hymenobacter sp. GOD-10R TaxID=3093922 RepID=UPI002D7A2A0E|nr:hypothetical protein [Hymenobacter sp. GOD-10R]WRQ26306.1 hypothetical protein SD425_14580 [Hymenobacter sp. GOD-10R]
MATSHARPPKAPHFANAVGDIYYSTQGHIHLQWSADRIQLTDLQAFYEQALLLLDNTDSRKILSEHGQRQPLSAAAQHWITREWLPRAMKQVRAEYCAIVDGSNPMHRLSTQTVITDAPSDFIFKRFDTVSEAEAWLGSLPR